MAYSNYGYAPGGQIQQSLPRQVEYKGLKDYISIEFIDTDPTSDNFFNVLEFPTKLTSGKNLFKLRANANTLAKDSQIHFEILDFNDEPIYYEPLDYFEPDGTRVVTIWINKDTVPGLARVYIAGRSRINPDTGQPVPFSTNYNSPDYLNIPNTLWSRTVTIETTAPNKTEIIFDPNNEPKIFLSEKIFPFFRPTQVIETVTEQFDGTYAEIKSTTGAEISVQANVAGPQVGDSDITTYTYYDNSTDAYSTYGVQGVSSNKLVADKAFFQAAMLGGVLRIEQPLMEVPAWTFAISGSVTQDGESITNALAVPQTQMFNSTNYDSYIFSENTIGATRSFWGWIGDGYFEQQADFNTVYGSEFYANYFYTGNEGVGPYTGQAGEPPAINNYNAQGNVTNQMRASGSYLFTIFYIENDTTAYGQFIEAETYVNGATFADQGQFQFRGKKLPATNANIAGPDKVPNPRGFHAITNTIQNTAYDVFETLGVTNFTASIQNTEYVTHTSTINGETYPTQLSQSFADIFLKNIDPLSGDVYAIRTFYKPGGMFGDWILAGDTRVEPQEVFYSTSSFENLWSYSDTGLTGINYRRPGFFLDSDPETPHSLTEWATTNVHNSNAPADGGFERIVQVNYILSASLGNTNLMSSVTLNMANYLGGNIGDPGTLGNTSKPFGHFIYKGLGTDGSNFKNQLYFEENTTYEITFKAYATDEIKNTVNPNIRVPRLDVYLNDYDYNNSYLREGDIITPSDQADKHRYDLDIPFVNTLDSAQDDGYITDFSNRYGKHILAVEGTPDTAVFNISGIFKTTKALRASPTFVIRRGKWTIGDISIKTVKETGFTPNTTRLRLKVPTEYRNIPLSFKFQFVDYQGKPADLQTILSSITFSGSNFVISGEDNLLTGSLFISDTVGSGLELAGLQSGFLRSLGYTGFESASRTDQPGGFIMYSGSVLPTAPDNYQGVGLELVRDSSSFFKFKTDGTDAGLEVQTDKFFLGSNASQFISGSGGLIEISSSNFRLSPEGNVTGSNILLTGNARADIFEYKNLTISAGNSGSFLNQYTFGGRSYYELDLSNNAAMFIRLDFGSDDILFPIAKINIPSGDLEDRAQTIYIESADSNGIPIVALSQGNDLDIVIDSGDLLDKSFTTRTYNGTSYLNMYTLPIGCRMMCVRSKFDWKIQSLSDYSTATASFAALNLGDGTTITTATPDVDGGSF